MGYVFRAQDEALNRTVALKVMLPEVAAAAIASERFLREGRAAAAIKSDHVITIYQVGDANGVPYLAMEYLEGLTLDDWLKAWQKRRQQPVPATVIVHVAKDMLKGLMAAHEKGIVHRDIKPANLWVEAGTNRIKLLDFGLTRSGGSDQGLTQFGQVLGTPAYMAPEQARGDRVDPRADLFSVGVVLYRMLAGANPFQRDTVIATLAAIERNYPPPAATLGVIPLELSALIDSLLSKNPDDRPPTSAAAHSVVLEAERRLREGGGPLVPPAIPTIPTAPLQDRDSKMVPLPTGTGASCGDKSLIVPRSRGGGVVPPAGPSIHSGSETEEAFAYAFNGEKRSGRRRVLWIDVGGGQMMEFIFISKGTFMMGAQEQEEVTEIDEHPQRCVEISQDFYMGKFQVTQAQYKAVTGDSPSRFKGEQLPVEMVSWEDVGKFCDRVSSRTKRRVSLPTEAQWEYACRAGTSTPFHFGSILSGDQANHDGNNPYGTDIKGSFKKATTAVGSYPANPWGLHDMHGNVWEWCRDYYGPYAAIPSLKDPVQLAKQSQSRRVLRGGSWSSQARFARAAYRSWGAPESRNYQYGFRVCICLDNS